ncbi:MAG TPA: 30S ribosomal protein S2, partial [Gaiellaceae bacterium]|nr:30S ribosomal protein S2 [Gaiellaceae bacterium]
MAVSIEAGSGGGGAAPARPKDRATNGGAGAGAVSMRDLLEAGVHFGHQTRRWNPKMRRFI